MLDTFRLIAENISQMFYILSTDYGDLFHEEKKLLKASGVIDTLVYLTEETITLKDIDLALFHAQGGRCAVGIAMREHENKKGVTEVGLFFGVHQVEDLFLNFTLQMECLIFRAEHSLITLSDDVILNSVVSKKKTIKKTIDKTLEKAARGDVDPNLKRLVDAFMTEPKFKELRNDILL